MAPHALLLPYPAQGHVIPFMELAHLLLDRGFAVTFVNTEFNHRRVVDAAAAVLAVLLAAKKLIRDGVIDDDGAPTKKLLEEENSSFRLAESTPPMDATFLAWNYMMGSRDAARMVFHYLTATAWAAADKADVLLCNTFEELEPAVFAAAQQQQQQHSAPSILPIGPLRTWQREAAAPAVVGHFWRADEDACLAFLDAQPHGAVVYVAFGSLTVMSPAQLEELGAALGSSGRPFLWVLRPGLAGATPAAAVADLVARHGGRGKVVGWAPQERVLAHPAVGCFVTHCGWNSTLEGVRAGVPLLCWPYFTDQFANHTYVCDVWRVGLRVAAATEEDGAGGAGVVSRERILERLESLMGDGGVKERVRRLKGLVERSMSGEGRSLKNLKAFVDAMGK